MSRIVSKPSRAYPWYMRIIFFFQRRKYGKVLAPVQAWGRCPQVFMGFLMVNNRLNRKKALISPKLRALVSLRVSQINRCAFCVDLHSRLVLEGEGSVDKLEALGDYQESVCFSDEEKIVLTYTEAMTRTDVGVDDALFRRLRKFFSGDEVVELTALIAFQNMSSQFNTALNIPSEGLCNLK